VNHMGSGDVRKVM